MAKVQIVYINRTAGNGTGNAPAATYESQVLDEGTFTLPTDGRFKTALIFPLEEDVFIAVGTNPDVDEVKQQILVPLGNNYEVALGVGQRFAVKASGTNAGTGAGGGGGGPGGVADTVKIDATQNTVKVDGTVPVSGPATNSQLRATPLPVAIASASASGPLDVALTSAVDVLGPLTNTELRAAAVPVSGSVGVTGNVAVTGPLTDTQLRAAAVPVSGTVTATGPLTNAQLTLVSGTAAAAIWSGTGDATIIAVLKALYSQNEEIKVLLGDIKTNTTPTP